MATSSDLAALQKRRSQLKGWENIGKEQDDESPSPAPPPQPHHPAGVLSAAPAAPPQSATKGTADPDLRAFLNRLYAMEREMQQETRAGGYKREPVDLPVRLALELQEVSKANGISKRLIIAAALTQWLETFRQILRT